MKLYNTLTRKIEELQPVNPSKLTMYSCGPTVYDYTHIGHVRKFTMDDILKRALKYVGHDVQHVMNITDVGHLTGDNDSGEDKLEKGAKTLGRTVWDVSEFYTDFFFRTTKTLKISPADVTCKATDHIPDMVELIKQLEKKGFTYETAEAVYFDVKKFATYGQLSGQKLEDKLEGVRDQVNIDAKKKHPADFALWFKQVGRFAEHSMHWPSPWGDGFPGWHIECSAMSMKYLGETIDIHTGGTDHIPVHHENEIAQSEAATGKPFVKHWVHHAFLNINEEKMGKSKGNFITIDHVQEQGIDPVSLRLLFLQTHYRQEMNFSWEAAKGAHEAFKKLKEAVLQLRNKIDSHPDHSRLSKEMIARFKSILSNDLQTPMAVAYMWDVLKSEDISPADKQYVIFSFDEVFGLGLAGIREEKLPQHIIELAEKREQVRKVRNFDASDRLRKQIEEKGYVLKDTEDGYRITKK